MKSWKITAAIFLIFSMLFLTNCQKKTESFDPAESIESAGREQSLHPTGSEPQEKVNKLVDYFISKWLGYIHISGQYSFIPMFGTDMVFFNISILPKVEDSEKQAGSPPEINDVIGEVVWLAAWEIQAKEIKVNVINPDGIIDSLTFKNGKAIRQGSPSDWQRLVDEKLSGAIFSFPVDDPEKKSIYRIVGFPGTEDLRQQFDNWNKKWAGEVWLNGKEALTDAGQLKNVRLFARLGFRQSTGFQTQELYKGKRDYVLGEITRTLVEKFAPQNILMVVLDPNGNYLAYYSKEGAIRELKNRIAELSPEEILLDWSAYFIVKPVTLQPGTISQLTKDTED